MKDDGTTAGFRRWRRGWAAVLTAAVTVLAGGVAAVVSAPAASAAVVDTNAWYVLVNRNSGKALDVYNLATNDGARPGDGEQACGRGPHDRCRRGRRVGLGLTRE